MLKYCQRALQNGGRGADTGLVPPSPPINPPLRILRLIIIGVDSALVVQMGCDVCKGDGMKRHAWRT